MLFYKTVYFYFSLFITVRKPFFAIHGVVDREARKSKSPRALVAFTNGKMSLNVKKNVKH